MTAPARWYIGRSRARAAGACSLALLGVYAALMAAEAVWRDRAFEALQPWRLGGPGPGPALSIAALSLGLGLGWLVPGLSLALLSDRSLRGGRLLGRAFGLGVGYVLLSNLSFAIVAGHAPGRAGLLVLLALPPLAALWRPDAAHASPPDSMLRAACVSMILLTGLLWPKLVWESLNGDGTEAYELARSLDRTRLPHWDLERPEAPGAFGYPAVNPTLTSSYLIHVQMVVLGPGELSARLAFPVALVACAVLVLSLARTTQGAALGYVAASAALVALWNAFYVGYEPAFPDLAGLATSDLLMTALWLAGALELARGLVPLGVAFLLLASGVLYSAPLLASAAIVAYAVFGGSRGRGALVLWTAGLASALATALCVGYATGSLPDWIRQIRSEYWQDFVEPGRRAPLLPLLGRLVLATGALVLAALPRFRRLTPVSRALLIAGAAYLALVACGQAKSLHYLTPLPFLFAPAALEASGWRLQAAATAIVGAAFALSWPLPLRIHREAALLGRISCLRGVDLEDAALGGDVVYEAFARPGTSARFAIGKHTFARYAL